MVGQENRRERVRLIELRLESDQQHSNSLRYISADMSDKCVRET